MKKVVLVMLIICLAALSGCSSFMNFETQSFEQVALPDVQSSGENAPWGDSQTEALYRASAYYVNEDAQRLVETSLSFMLADSSKRIEAILDEFFKNDSQDAAVRNPAPEGTRVRSVEITDDIVTVDLTLDARGVENAQKLAWLYAAITDTLASLDEVRGVNILIGGRVEPVDELPVGVMGASDGNLTNIWAQQQADLERLTSSTNPHISREVLLYLPAMNGGWFVTETRELNFTSENFAAVIMAALSATADATTAKPILNAVNALAASPSMQVSADGKRYLTVRFDSSINDIINAAGFTHFDLMGTLALTMTSFIPQLDGLKVYINDMLITDVSRGEETKSFEEGVIRRSDYSEYIGDVAKIYFPSASGGLRLTERVTQPGMTRNARALIEALMDGDANGRTVFPDGVSYSDILGIRVDNNVAYINLSANFYRQCQSLSDSGERDLIYSIVNTITELDDVRGVRFTFEGRSVETLTGKIYLKSILLRNIGLVETS